MITVNLTAGHFVVPGVLSANLMSLAPTGEHGEAVLPTAAFQPEQGCEVPPRVR